MAYEKNLGVLVDVLERVPRGMPDVRLVIAGEGPALGPLGKDVARRLLELSRATVAESAAGAVSNS